MPKYTLNLSDDTVDILLKSLVVFASGPAAIPDSKTRKLEFAIRNIAVHFDAGYDDSPPVPRPSDDAIQRAVDKIVSPDISLGPVDIHHEKPTPRDVDGFVPWSYIVAGYSTLTFVESSLSDENRIELIRRTLTRIPEDTWETDQTKAVVEKVLAELNG